MSKHDDHRMARFEIASKYADLANITGATNDPLLAMYYDGVARGSEQTLGKSAGMLDNQLTGRALLAQLRPTGHARIRPLRKEEGIILGREVHTGIPTGFRYEDGPISSFLVGATGCGKTNTIFVIESQLPPGTKRICIDSKREWSRYHGSVGRGAILRADQFYDNPFEPVGDPIASRLARFEHIAAHIAIDERTWPDIPGLMAAFERTMPQSVPILGLADTCHVLDAAGKNTPKYRTAATRLWPVADMLGERAFVVRGPNLFDRYDWIVLDYSKTPSNIRNLLHACMLDKLFQKLSQQGHGTDLRFMFFWDEALDVFAREHSSTRAGSGYVSYQRTTVNQSRSYGCGHTTCAQYASQTDKCSTASVNNLVVFMQGDYDEARESSRLLGVGDKLAEAIQKLPKGHAYLRTPSQPEPIEIVIPLVPCGEYLSTDEIDRTMADELNWMRNNSVMSPRRSRSMATVSYSDVFGDNDDNGEGKDIGDQEPLDMRKEYSDIVAEIRAHPDASVVEHYVNLGWSAGRGTRVKAELIANGILEAQRQRSVNGRPIELLVLTEKGREVFNDEA